MRMMGAGAGERTGQNRRHRGRQRHMDHMLGGEAELDERER